MMDETPFRELWLKFSEQELLPDVDWLFRHAPPSVKNTFCTIHLQEGYKLIQQGTENQYTYIIIEGEFVVNKLADNGKELALTFCYKGEFLGEMEALCQQKHYCYDVIALTDARVIRIPTDSFLVWLSQDHRLSILLNRQLAKRSLINGEQRLMTAVDSIEKNLLYILTQISSHQIRLPRETLAAILGTSRRHLDKVLFKLKEQGMIRQKGQIILLSN
nr:Crp/Fnr family transcriptional regulator [Providencia stuartii]ELR5080470.1 Crp/Fnr family transcriptional regulator [Providencia stuartii]